MAPDASQMEVYLEIGKKRTFAVAIDWLGWCRSGRDETAALQTLIDYGQRYARVVQATQLKFSAPTHASALVVVERVEGNATTDFGAPSITLSADSRPPDPVELERWQMILKACWDAFDAAVQAATGRTLSKGPRGGGRDLAKVTQHVREVEAAYLTSLGGKLEPRGKDTPDQTFGPIREAILATLVKAAHGEIPARGPRGGLRWTPRYFVRRLAWHDLDHTWEIEDRAGL